MRWFLIVLMLMVTGCAANKNGEVAGFGDGQIAELNGLANVAADIKAAATAMLEVKQDGGSGEGQRAAQSGGG